MIERGMDEVEVAGQLQELEGLRGRAAAAAALRPQVPEGVTVCDCVDCGKALPPVRIAYKWVRCAPCQAEVERQLKRRR